MAVDTPHRHLFGMWARRPRDVICTPGSIVAVRPLKDGVIADFDITASMLQSFIRKACGGSKFARPRVIICIPLGVTAVERWPSRRLPSRAPGRSPIIEEPMAAAIGAGLPVAEATGSMVVDIGGGIQRGGGHLLGGIVAGKSGPGGETSSIPPSSSM